MAVRKSSAGGAALQGGAAYQNRVAAWLAVEMLAESQAAPLSPGGGSIEILRAETQESMDDLLVGTSLERYTFLQAKRRISTERHFGPRARFSQRWAPRPAISI